MVRSLAAVVCVALACAGCRASARASVNTGKKTEDFSDGPVEPVEEGEGESDFDPNAERALLGARHDLRPAPNVTNPTCTCLAVVLGDPSDSKFVWLTAAPSINPQDQLVIALTSEGLACQGEPEGSLGASYWGYRQEGDDVIVIVEAAKMGRPITTGAVIPKPVGTGQVYVRPASKAIPYGRSLDTTQRDCKIGNPGPVRSEGFTPTDSDTLD